MRTTGLAPSLAFVALLATTAAAAPTPLDLQVNHANGSVLVVRGIEIGPDTIRLDITLTTADRPVHLNHSASMVLIDDRGARYQLVPPPDNAGVDVPENSRMRGEMIFSGRLQPGTRRLVLSTNEGVGGGTGRYEQLPIFKVEIPLPAEAAATPAPQDLPSAPAAAGAAPAPAPLHSVEVDQQAIHANGAVLRVRRVEVLEDAVALDLRITTADRPIRLNHGDSMKLVDDRGNVYRVVPPEANEALEIAEHSRADARVLFNGRLHPEARQLTLTTNEGVGGGSGRYEQLPLFRLSLALSN